MVPAKNSDYWKERFEQLEAAQNQKGIDAYDEIEQIYKQAQREIEGGISRWYQRLAANNGVSMAEARKMLSSAELKEFKWDVKEYIKYGQENALTGAWMKELENASAKFHISRLEALKMHTQHSLEVMFAKQHGITSGAMAGILKSGYYHTAYELQKGFGIGWDIAGLDQGHIEKLLSKPWAVDGKNFSERIWGNKQKLISEIHNELTRNIMLGKDPQKAIDAIAKKMNTFKNNAGRLVMTEEAYFSSAAQKECFNDLDVEKYEIVATLDSHTSDICQSLDGNVFAMKDFEPGVTAPPFHVYCRSTTVPYFDDGFGQPGERAARDAKTGKTYYVPDNMNYQEWKETFVDGGDKSRLTVYNQDGDIHWTRKEKTDKIKARNELMKDLPSLSEVKTNGDIKAFAEQLIDNLSIDRTNIKVSVKGIKDFGCCAFGNGTTQNTIHYQEYVLNANDGRTMAHRIKTAFHEAYHLMAEGNEWDGLTAAYRIKESWRSLEETFTESSAHFLLGEYGVTDKIAPSYAKELARNLPRLKRLDKYSSCKTIQDFGRIAFKDRKNGKGALWGELSKKMKQVKLTDNYYAQYYQYIKENEDELFDMLLANMPGFAHYRMQMKNDLKSAMNKELPLLSDNEQIVYYGIMSCAMQKVGVK